MSSVSSEIRSLCCCVAAIIPSFSGHFGGIDVVLCEARVVGRLLTRYTVRAEMHCRVLFQVPGLVLSSRAWLWLGNAGPSLWSAEGMRGRQRYAWRC